MVYLVGAGPGDIRLITVKGLECVKKAETIVYDRLVNKDILRSARPDAELVFAGKSREGHVMTQDAINRLLVERAREGRIVVRLKGGDPILFGRGAEEAMELKRHGVEYEIVPGVSSAIAVGACAGIPLTHRKVASSVTIVTGNEDPSKTKSVVDWSRAVGKHATLVILMGLENIASIMLALKKNGADETLPAAVIQDVSMPQQRVIVGTIRNIAARASRARIVPPAVIVVGEVVGLRGDLGLEPRLPLRGKRILVTRPRSQAAGFAAMLEREGASVVRIPLIRTVPLTQEQRASAVMKRIATYDGIVVSSVNGVDHLMDALSRHGIARSRLGKIAFAAIGPKTARRLERYNLRATVVPREFRQEGLAESMMRVRPKGKILIARSEEGRDFLGKTLAAHGFEIEELTLYASEPAPGGRSRIRSLLAGRMLDVITLTSSSCARSLRGMFDGSEIKSCLKDVLVAAIGPVTAEAARSCGIRIDIVAKEYTVEGLTSAIRERYRQT